MNEVDPSSLLTPDDFISAYFSDNREEMLSWECLCGERHEISEVCPLLGIDEEECGRRRKATRLLLGNMPSEDIGKKQTVLQYLKNAAFGVLYKKGYRIYNIEEGIGNGLLTLYKKIDQYDPDKGEFHSWALSVILAAVKMSARKEYSMGSHYNLSIEQIIDESTDERKSSDTELELGLFIEDNYRIEDRLEMAIRAARRKIAISVFGEQLYLDAMSEISTNERGWVRVLAKKYGMTPQNMYAKMAKAKAVYEEREGLIIEGESN